MVEVAFEVAICRAHPSLKHLSFLHHVKCDSLSPNAWNYTHLPQSKNNLGSSHMTAANSKTLLEASLLTVQLTLGQKCGTIQSVNNNNNPTSTLHSFF